jgi:hypothetical protein
MADQFGAAEQPAAFEVAAEILDQLVGYAATRADSVQAGSGSGRDAADGWQRRAAEWAQRRRDLMPGDSAAIGRVLDEDAAILRTLVTGLR